MACPLQLSPFAKVGNRNRSSRLLGPEAAKEKVQEGERLLRLWRGGVQGKERPRSPKIYRSL